MRIICFGTKPYDREYFERFNAEGKFGHHFTFLEARLTEQTAPLAKDYEGVCIFVNDVANRKVCDAMISSA